MKSDKVYLKHILESIERIDEYVGDMTGSSFIKDQKTVDAVVRAIEIIGEASNKLSKSFKDENLEIEWQKVIGMRNRLIHDYFGVDVELVWFTVKNDLPTLKKQIQKFLK